MELDVTSRARSCKVAVHILLLRYVAHRYHIMRAHMVSTTAPPAHSLRIIKTDHAM